MSAYVERVGRETDVWLNVAVYAGREGETVSRHAALDRDAGKPVGCAVCAILGALVEKDHCTKTLDPNEQEATAASVKAGALMIVFIGLVYLLTSAAIRLL